MGKPKWEGQIKPYTPNNKADPRYQKHLSKNGSTPPTVITSLRVMEVSLVPDAEPCCRIIREKEQGHG